MSIGASILFGKKTSGARLYCRNRGPGAVISRPTIVANTVKGSLHTEPLMWVLLDLDGGSLRKFRPLFRYHDEQCPKLLVYGVVLIKAMEPLNANSRSSQIYTRRI